jgi:hypothetical protein
MSTRILQGKPARSSVNRRRFEAGLEVSHGRSIAFADQLTEFPATVDGF